MDIFYNKFLDLSSIFLRPHISAHICDFAQAVTLGHVRQVRSARELSSKSQLCTNLCGRKTLSILALFVFIIKYAPVALGLEKTNSALFAHLDKIPTLPKYRKRKAKRRVRSIPTKRNGVYSASE